MHWKELDMPWFSSITYSKREHLGINDTGFFYSHMYFPSPCQHCRSNERTSKYRPSPLAWPQIFIIHHGRLKEEALLPLRQLPLSNSCTNTPLLYTVIYYVRCYNNKPGVPFDLFRMRQRSIYWEIFYRHCRTDFAIKRQERGTAQSRVWIIWHIYEVFRLQIHYHSLVTRNKKQ